MAYKTTSNAKGLIILEAEIQKLNEEIGDLRQYRKRAKKAYRSLQAAHERTQNAYYGVLKTNDTLRKMAYGKNAGGKE